MYTMGQIKKTNKISGIVRQCQHHSILAAGRFEIEDTIGCDLSDTLLPR